MMGRLYLFVVLLLMICPSGGGAVQKNPFPVTVLTKSEQNKVLKVWCRIPRGYDAQRKKEYRVLILFGGRNGSGETLAKGALGFGAWADQKGIFLVAPSFRDDDYWHPEKWSGWALWKALIEVKKTYRINTTKVLYYGYSAGGQCANLFAAWRPDLARAWVAQGCGVFHKPDRRMKGVPGLVACGDADASRYLMGKRFVSAYRTLGANIVWKTYPNLPHTVPDHMHALARAFLGYYDDLYSEELLPNTRLNVIEEKPAYVGDDQEQEFYPVGSPKEKSILCEDRVWLISREVAEAWGKEGRK